ncbi:MAG TPA: hypothetical protein VFF67_07305 [Thermoplasmata archaeon]|nr:hypothetical protein [Thermoplasmata archaeon]
MTRAVGQLRKVVGASGPHGRSLAMSSALVLGERGSGLTTFLGLLYTAQVRLGVDASDEFRFSADRGSIRRMGEIYSALGTGQFPDSEVGGEHEPVSFVFGFRRGRFPRLGGPAGSADREFDSVRIQVGGIPTDEVAELDRHDAVLDVATRRLLRSPVVVPIVDASSLPDDGAGASAVPVTRFDHSLSATLGLLAKFRAAERRWRARHLFPLFVVTKLDRVRPEVRSRLQVPEGPVENWPLTARYIVGRRLLHEYLPETARILIERGAAAVSIDRPGWFFSGLRMEERRGGSRIARRSVPPNGGWEPEYPFEEYKALLLRMSELARRLPEDDGS